MKTKDEIEKKLLSISSMSQDGDNPEHKDLLAQQEILEWVLGVTKQK